MIFLLFNVLDKFHFHLKWYQSKLKRGTRPLSYPALFNLKLGRFSVAFHLKSGREELYSIYLMYFVTGTRFHIKQYWTFQGVTTKWYCTLFQSSYQWLLTLSESYHQIRVNTFSEFISNITDSFRELLPNNITHISRHQTIMTFSESYWQTIL